MPKKNNEKSDNRNVYLYFHINPVKNEIFYVGIGTTGRAWNYRQRNIFWKRTFKKYGVIVNIVEDKLTLDEAVEREKYYINKIGRRNLKLGPLVNLTDGGEYFQGIVYTDEIRKRMSDAAKGRIMSAETKKKISIFNKGKVLTQSDKDKKSKSQMGHNVSTETRRKLSDFRTGKTPYNKGIPMSEEQKLKLSSVKKGKPNNKLCKPFIIDDIEYRTLQEAKDKLNIGITCIFNRLKSTKEEYSNYTYK